jgi:hypothetical protein
MLIEKNHLLRQMHISERLSDRNLGKINQEI